MRRRLASLATSAATTTRRRLRLGPRQPSWSWQYEVVIDWMRDRFRRTGVPLEVTRRAIDAAGDLERRRRGVRWAPERAGGVPAEWALPWRPCERVVLYLHGGGYAFGSVHSHRGLIGAVARRSQARVLALDYRLAPEHPCPAAIDDVIAAWRWLLAKGVRPEHVTFAGDSAGGGLALSGMLALRALGLPLPAGAALLSPWTDLAVTGESCTLWHEHDYLGTQASLYAFAGHYAGALDRRDPRVSPLYADLAGLPPLLVLAGGVEVLLDDSVRLVHRAREAGVDATLHVAPEEVHVYPSFGTLTPRGREALDRVAAFVRR